MKKFTSFTDIKQFRQIVRNVSSRTRFVGLDDNGKAIYDSSIPLPTLTFTGTIKIHGTNSGVCSDGENLWYQSREDIKTIENDNHGFSFFAESKKEILLNFINEIRSTNEDFKNKTICLYGEWCGGNIQKNIALNGLEKRLILFAVKVSDGENSKYLKPETWKHLKDHDNRIYNIYDFKTFSIDVDFNYPQRSINKMIELVNEVELECPVGKYFGRKLGEDNTIGEGIVWDSFIGEQRYIFKTKGEKHSVTKVKKLVEVDIEKLNSIKEFVEYAVTEERLNQAIQRVFTEQNEEIRIEKTSNFLRWIVNDIIKEETDTLIENNLEPKEVNKYISAKAKPWFMNKLNEF
jgi:hypothetical protein